ncbi:MAG: 23S rRNA (guanosine(2251)-2'-O)-methyltransferase RlmB [Candidatus Omnitrophica bacterium]|nr:23S rRNA (guanosine(2251)-2'-O)-methyltransferase RlmB [Candidatus Omnitrophota bacterium]MBU2250682.1 23S rRNA (guanosine(2251)-2'-O)-methyltransferase RlmB [Candidatus Omnitrophota bacterium]
MPKQPIFLYGKNSVFERLKNSPQTIRKIFLKNDFKLPQVEELIKLNKIPTEHLSPDRLWRIKPVSCGGIIAQVDNFQYSYLEDLILKPKNELLSLIFLDRIFDPQNLGAIIRICACFGSFGVVIPKHKACEVTETVLHVACGGENFVPVAMVSNLSNALLKAKEAGYWAAGTVVQGGSDIAKSKLPYPLCLILGSEGKGMRYGLSKHIDTALNIPMPGADISFNVTAACAIFCYEIIRQKGGF